MPNDVRWLALARAMVTAAVGFVLLQWPSIGPVSTEARAPACSGDPMGSPTFVYPSDGSVLRTDDDYVFAVAPVNGATAYRWELSQHGAPVVSTVEPVGGFPDLGYELLHSLAYAAEANWYVSAEDSLPPPALTPGITFAVEVGTAAHKGIEVGDLTALVSAEVCGRWTPDATTRVEITCDTVGPDGPAPVFPDSCT